MLLVRIGKYSVNSLWCSEIIRIMLVEVENILDLAVDLGRQHQHVSIGQEIIFYIISEMKVHKVPINIGSRFTIQVNRFPRCAIH